TAKLISDSVIQQYVELLRDSQYQEAWETCLSDQAKKDIPVNEFITAKTAHRKEFGPIIGFRNTRVTDENDISSSPSFMGIIGVLEYENRDLFVKFLVSPDIEPYKIQRIFGSSHRSTSLSEGVW
ncbi:MAG: hypothetical protein HOM11_10040, partial [Methylococcales bacterium]|nr:hypothetical protein [Methylococcales bacterium]